MYTCKWLGGLVCLQKLEDNCWEVSYLVRAWPLLLFYCSEYLPQVLPRGNPGFTSYLTIGMLSLQMCATAFGFFMWVSWVPGVKIRCAMCAASAVIPWAISLASKLLLGLSQYSWTSSVNLLLSLFPLFSFLNFLGYLIPCVWNICTLILRI